MKTRFTWISAFFLVSLFFGGLQVEPVPVFGALHARPVPVFGALHASLEAFSARVEPASGAAQEPKVITMDREPHHHLMLHNNFVNVFDAKAAAGDMLLLHRHDHEAVAIAIGDQMVTVGVPGKPDVHSKNPDGQIRMQRTGYVHTTHVDGDAAYYTVAVELLRPQTGARNLCAVVLPGEPLNCAAPSASLWSPKMGGLPQFESEQTRIEVTRVPPHQSVEFGNSRNSQLLVALDDAKILVGSGSDQIQTLRPGDFVWIDQGSPARRLENKSDEEVRVVNFAFKP